MVNRQCKTAERSLSSPQPPGWSGAEQCAAETMLNNGRVGGWGLVGWLVFALAVGNAFRVH